MSLISFANFDGASKNAANAQDSAVAGQRLAGATYIGNELLWLWQPKPKKCRKQLNGHLSFQTTITNRLESTFPPHLCKKIKFVPDSRQPFENDRIFNLVGLKRLTQNISDGDVAVEGFRLFRRDRSTGHQGGGVCFYVHHTINVKRLCHLEHPALEMLWLEITIGKEKVKISCLYRPPSSSIEFWSTLEKASEEVQGHSIILLGDLNVNSMDKTDS